MKYSDIVSILGKLENKWVAHLRRSVPNPTPTWANGEVQFFSVEHASPTTPEDIDLPVIVGVGINYGQTPRPLVSSYPERHLLTQKGHLVEDKPPAIGMRHAVDATCNAYQSNWTLWRDYGYAPSVRLPTISEDYILIATNFCPFLTKVEWTQNPPLPPIPAEEKTKLLDASWPPHHLDDLHAHLNGSVDLWVGHGKVAVWQPFAYWRRMRGISNWLLSANLSTRWPATIAPSPTGRRRFWQIPRAF